MNDTLLLILVPVAALGGLAGVAYLLNRRAKKHQPADYKIPEASPTDRRLLWIIRILVTLMVITVIVAFAFNQLWLLWVTAGCIVIYIIIGWVRRIVRLSGK